MERTKKETKIDIRDKGEIGLMLLLLGFFAMGTGAAMVSCDNSFEHGTYVVNTTASIAILIAALAAIVFGYKMMSDCIHDGSPRMDNLYKDSDGHCTLSPDQPRKCGKDCRTCGIAPSLTRIEDNGQHQ